MKLWDVVCALTTFPYNSVLFFQFFHSHLADSELIFHNYTNLIRYVSLAAPLPTTTAIEVSSYGVVDFSFNQFWVFRFRPKSKSDPESRACRRLTSAFVWGLMDE